METASRPRLLYPSMVIAAVAVTVFSLLGIAALSGALPLANSATTSGSGYGIDERTTENKPAGGEATAAKPKPACGNCGVVESVRAVEVKERSSGVGAVAGGIAGALLGNGIGQGNGRTVATLAGAAGGAYAGNEIEKNTKKHTSYRIRVRMADNSLRTLYQREAPDIGVGERVKIVDDALLRQS